MRLTITGNIASDTFSQLNVESDTDEFGYNVTPDMEGNFLLYLDPKEYNAVLYVGEKVHKFTIKADLDITPLIQELL